MTFSIYQPPGIESVFGKIIYILIFAAVAHLASLAIRNLSTQIINYKTGRVSPKARSIASLANSFIVFSIYFWVIGFILQTLGVSLTAYLASASVIGLAVGFGSQGLVQDVVTGLTLVFSNLIDIGDMVEIGGQTGIIRSIGMRFTLLENSMKAQVYIPNRSITNVINYPRGYVRCLIDVPMPDSKPHPELKTLLEASMSSFTERFPGLFIYPPSIEEDTGKSEDLLRLKFRIWPGRGTPLETTFKSELLQRLRNAGLEYFDWQISVHYEVEKNKTSAGV
ncbi:MAG: small-conductance mechanosensitive channel [Desulforhopalus sp.]|jgi:small-conductance mechanosensitive channel